MKQNTQIAKASGALTTSGVTSGLLNPEQSKKFIQMTFEATPLGPLVRHEMRRAKTGEIDKIGIASRIIRKKIEDTDDNYRVKNLNSPRLSMLPRRYVFLGKSQRRHSERISRVRHWRLLSLQTFD